VCGKPLLAGLNKKTCSRACANKNRAGLSYKNGNPKDKVKAQRALKARLLKERGLQCERCGYDKVPILQVHHKDRNRQHNELKNLELICPNCHAEEHYLENSWWSGRIV
jgi:5-methylcytosine-specific restriction endonuclease McrA